ncbi:6-phosphogluconate dehydrogenase C-terminal domain-like protein [Laetiporus sulphureus 93-53]|uniref:6-phosphogluconate dehydrogenase C-terminal domain-like protein n=1 Tax=Laetiporus sulphureus 93-53 TaxID=1314785 RepID=A0A165DDN3_9APHY|nr:6-phosphogluconate dehydrogenase C-terminal domain-like protein [Laetiporus sulphureus 93-53]KZT04647.1 6-phosphogluconate dehydrogenase C-terminal domain-like protein [Laetiporus sulphureus 93-53]
MSPPTLAIVAAGAMGSAVARRFTSAGCTVLTNLDGRSPATRARASAAGMQDVPMRELAARAEWILSILPPSEAMGFAESYLDAHADIGYSPDGHDLNFADCNAVSPETVKKIAAMFKKSPVGFVDAGIIGGPPKDGYDPVFYASADDAGPLNAFSGLQKWGLNVSLLKGEGAGVGDASALKMSYAGITKGITGLCTTMILAAHSSSPATAQALLRELGASQPMILQRITRTVPDMLPKAYRWVGEMEEISSFVGGGAGQIHQGMARIYERVERSLKEEEEGKGGNDVKALRDFVEEAKKLLEEKK